MTEKSENKAAKGRTADQENISHFSQAKASKSILFLMYP